ncbi:MAG: hypothetical protein LBT10_01875 [Methanobrevibacter sp.]|jgi:hypothetical protein|nr:hypothetical protein [Methanobrevibacter sp.]
MSEKEVWKEVSFGKEISNLGNIRKIKPGFRKGWEEQEYILIKQGEKEVIKNKKLFKSLEG